MTKAQPTLTEGEIKQLRLTELQKFDVRKRDYARPIPVAERARRIAVGLGIPARERQDFVSRHSIDCTREHERQMRRMELAQALFERLKACPDPSSQTIVRQLMTIEYDSDLTWIAELAAVHGLMKRGSTRGRPKGSGMESYDEILVETAERLTARRKTCEREAPEDVPPLALMTKAQAIRAVSEFAFGAEGAKAKRLERYMKRFRDRPS